jgi:hypothetical protein
MSSKNNVNKDHYTQAGRDRPNENVVHSDHKEAFTRAQQQIAIGEAANPHAKPSKRAPNNPPPVEGADKAQIPPLDTEPAEGLKEREVGGES